MYSHYQTFNSHPYHARRLGYLSMGSPYVPVNQNIVQASPNVNYYQPYLPNYFPQYTGWNQQNMYYPNNIVGGIHYKNQVQSLFQNPLEPKEPYPPQIFQSYPQAYNPYPKPNTLPKPSGGIGSIMNSFKGQDGSIDLNKMVNTAGQMINAVSQVSSMVKGLGGIFKV